MHNYSSNSCYLLRACLVLFSLLRSSCATYLQASSLPWETKPKFLAEREGLALASSGEPLFCPLRVLLWDPGRRQWRRPRIPEGVGGQMLRGVAWPWPVHPEGHMFMPSMQASLGGKEECDSAH
ncbi:unnamed protein product [Rangifer tarandus platyrhynchus]|uniref:Secreted protein n=1 Tax=Rangifer tarandus platyrhynchus TaxID=3082113 RepID=A0ABN9A3H8_RANTA|nr:unnamed protein product [Rangifer tarandus platyrhynchus]